jgi:NAD(P)-dependent dehydrogenase (short-subunit alcohol dehydrogenase family)
MGLIGLMNVIKLEGAKYNILVNTIAPLAASRMTEDIMPPEFLKQIPPDHVTPMVVYLCSEKCTSSGNIYNAGTGVFSRAAIMTGPSILIGDGKTPATAEEVMAKIGEIDSLEGAKPYGQLGEQVGDVMKALSGE